MATKEARPTMEQLREFARLPWVRCTTCGRVTAKMQARYDEILTEKEDTYYNEVEVLYEILISQGFDDLTAQRTADQQARVIADISFNRKIKAELGLQDYCCFNTLENPIVLPLGSGIELSPEVDVGQRMSQLRLVEAGTPKTGVSPVLPGAKGEVVAQPKVRRIYTETPWEKRRK